MSKKINELDELIFFQVYLNENDFISGHLWDYEKVAKQYLKNKNERNKLRPSKRSNKIEKT